MKEETRETRLDRDMEAVIGQLIEALKANGIHEGSGVIKLHVPEGKPDISVFSNGELITEIEKRGFMVLPGDADDEDDEEEERPTLLEVLLNEVASNPAISQISVTANDEIYASGHSRDGIFRMLLGSSVKNAPVNWYHIEDGKMVIDIDLDFEEEEEEE